MRFILSSSIAGVTSFLSSAAATHTQAVAPLRLLQQEEGKVIEFRKALRLRIQ